MYYFGDNESKQMTYITFAVTFANNLFVVATKILESTSFTVSQIMSQRMHSLSFHFAEF